jgi:cardiolipin synthase
VGRAALSFRRLVGLDRSGPPPAQTLPGAPLRPWTIPNAIGYLRAALIPVFLVFGLSSGDGTDATAAIVFAAVAWADYADGMAARITGQYSRMGTLLDPLVDRALVIAGLVVCWRFETLPRWAIATLLVREVVLLVAAQVQTRRGRPIEINWPGRLAVWPTMSGIFFAVVGVDELADPLFVVGVGMALAAAAQYAITTIGAHATRPSS